MILDTEPLIQSAKHVGYTEAGLDFLEWLWKLFDGKPEALLTINTAWPTRPRSPYAPNAPESQPDAKEEATS